MTLFIGCPSGEADEDTTAAYWFFLYRHGLLRKEFGLTLDMDDGVKLSDGLVLHYDGTVSDGRLIDAVDDSGVADLTLTDVESIQGHLPGTKALHFNGRTSYAESRYHIEAIELTTFSLSCWFRTVGLIPGTDYGMDGRLIAYAPKDMSYSAMIGDGIRYGWVLENEMAAEESLHFVPPGLNAPNRNAYLNGEWHHAVVLFGQYDSYKIYVDAVLQEYIQALDSAWNIDYSEYVNHLYLGSLGDFDPYCFFYGDLGDIRIYNRLLNEDEIQALFETT